jgi:regulator of sirC expression with transglutaminase-like and TPR domain
MDLPTPIGAPSKVHDSQKAALISLLADEDASVYQAVRGKFLSLGVVTRDWLHPHALSSNPLLRRRAQEIIRHFDRQTADDRFLTFCLKQGENFDLEEAAWLLAQTQYSDINVEAYQALLDIFVGELRPRVSLYKRANQMFGQINDYLFNELSFAGNEKDYYDPDNSYLNRVLDRRTGNPINLCLLYLLIARRLRLPVVGIGLPGHFLCRYQSTSDEIYIDAFNHGRLLSKTDCIHYLIRGNHDVSEDYLSPVSSRRLFHRICANLQHIYVQLERAEEATRVQRYLVALSR